MADTNVRITLEAVDRGTQNAFNRLQQALDRYAEAGERGGKRITVAMDAVRKTSSGLHSAVDGLKSRFNSMSELGKSAFDRISNSVSNTVTRIPGMNSAISTLSTSFSNTAETIRGHWTSAMEHIQSGIASVVGQDRWSSMVASANSATTSISSSFSSAFESISSSASSIGSRIGSALSSGISSAAQGIDSALSGISSKLSSLGSIGSQGMTTLGAGLRVVGNTASAVAQSFTGLSSTTSQMLGVFGAANFSQMTVGLSLSREKMVALGQASLDTGGNFKTLTNGLDEMTNQSVVSMDMMVQGLNKIKMSSGLSKEKIMELSTGIHEFNGKTMSSGAEIGKLQIVMEKLGSAALLMGDDMGHAQFVMSDAMDGLNGNFRTLQMNLGITKDKLLNAGWSGAATDVDGYLNALEKVAGEMGNTSSVMNTTAGKLEIVKKQFRVAGRQIGDSFKPALNWVLDGFLKLNNDGNIAAKSLLYMHGAFSTLAGVVPTVTQTFAPFGQIVHILTSLQYVTDLLTFATEMSTLASQLNSGAEVENSVAKTASAIAADEEALANLGLTGALQLTAAAAWELTTALLTNPYVWVAIAIIALVAILWHLYNTNEQVRNTFNQLFTVLKGAGIQAFNALKAIVGMLWRGLVQLGQAIWEMLVPAWNELNRQLLPLRAALSQLWGELVRLWNVLTQSSGASEEAGESFDVLGTIAKILGGIILGIVKNIITVVQVIMAVLIPVITFVVNYIKIIIHITAEISNVMKQVSDGTMSWGEALRKIGSILLEGFVNVLKSIGQMLWSIVDNLFGVAGASLDEVVRWLGEMANQTIIGLNEWVVAGVDGAIEFVQGIIDQITQLPGQFVEWLWNTLVGIWEWRTQIQTEAWNAGMDIINGIIQWLMQLPGQMWTWLWNALVGFGNWVMQLAMYAWNAGMSFVNTFIQWIMSLPAQAWAWLWNMIMQVLNWRNQVQTQALEAGRNFLQNVINFLMNLPSRVWSILQQVIQRVISWASNFVSNARNAATNAVNDHYNNFKNIRDKVRDALNRVIDAVISWARDFVSRVAQAGRDAVSGIWNAISGAASGGSGTSSAIDNDISVAENVVSNSSLPAEVGELGENMTSSFTESFDIASSSASAVGDVITSMSSIASSTIPSPTMSTPETPETPQPADTDMEMVTPTINSEQMGEDSTMVTESITQMSVLSTEQLTLMTQALQNLSLQSNNNLLTTQMNNQQTVLNYQQMVLQVNNQLTTLQNQNAQHWTQIKTKTETDLKQMLSTTKSVTEQMIDAWNVMKTSIVKAADEIKSQSESRFTSLWNTIKTFYHNIQHPGGAGSPSSGHRPSRTSSGSAFSRVKNAVRSGLTQSNTSPKVKKLSYMDLVSDYGFNSKDMEYIIPENIASTKIPIDYITRWFEGKKLNGGAGWEGVVRPNTEWIRTTTNAWDMAGPVILGKYATDPHFKVGQFENGTPTIDYDTFRGMAEDVFSQCHYEFYWDSERYGSWQAAAYNGGMNCSDSSDFLIAMAHACGLSASKVHGHWNQFGHFWAEVEGHKMDTTGWMQRRDWTPAASHAGTPARDPFSKLSDDLNSNGNVSDVNHSGNIEITIKHEFLNLPDTLGRNDVENILKESFDDRRFIKQLTSNPDFQELDKRMKMKELKKQGRYYGV